MATEHTQDDGGDEIKLLRLQFEEYVEASATYRAHAERCRDYRDGKQWSDAEIATLKKRKQPIITDNKIADKCDALLGIERQMRTDPKAFPRTPKHEQDAEAATDALRYVADQNDFQRAVRQRLCDNLTVEGLGAVEVSVEKYKGQKQPKICVRHIRWDRTYYDIHSLLPDFSDKRHAGFFTWMDVEEANGRWDDVEDVLEGCFTRDTAGSDSDTHADKPRYSMVSRKRKRVQIFTTYYQYQDVWKRAVWCYGGFLEKPAPSRYLDEHGEPDCAIDLQAVYRDRDGNPYGLVSNWLDRQDEINKRKSKMLHLLNTKQIGAPKGAFEQQEDGTPGIQHAREQLHLPDGGFEWVDGYGDKIQILDNLSLADGQWRLLVHSIDSLSTTGPNAALLGQTGHTSGVAKQVDQQAGTLMVAPLFEALGALQLRVYRRMWNCIRQEWTAEIWIRVTDDENNVKFVGLNKRLYTGDLAAKQLKSQQLPPDQKRAMIEQLANDPAMQQPAINPQTGQQQLEHEVAAMDVDIIIDESPDVVNIQQQEMAMLAEIAKARPEVPFAAMLEMSQLRSTTKKRVLDMISGADNPMAQQMAQMQQAMQQLAMALQKANVAKAEAEAEATAAKAQETQVDILAKTMNLIDPPQPAGKTQVSVN